jgi:hypothetical protein
LVSFISPPAAKARARRAATIQNATVMWGFLFDQRTTATVPVAWLPSVSSHMLRHHRNRYKRHIHVTEAHRGNEREQYPAHP